MTKDSRIKNLQDDDHIFRQRQFDRKTKQIFGKPRTDDFKFR